MTTINPYQQIPVGIPVSQNPYPLHPYTKNFPEEPESESPQIPNNNQQYYPQQDFPGQQQASGSSQPVQYYTAGQPYDPSSQYVMVGNPVTAASGPSKKKLERKIRDIDAKLEKGWYNAYYNWMYFLLGYSVLMIFQSVMMIFIVLTVDEFKGATVASIVVGGVLGIVICVWTIQIALVVKNGINGKSLDGMRRGLKSMNLYGVGYFIAFLVWIVVLEIAKNDLTGGEDPSWVVLYLVLFVIGYVVPIWVNIFGAKEVIKLLENREALVFECKTKFGSNLV